MKNRWEKRLLAGVPCCRFGANARLLYLKTKEERERVLSMLSEVVKRLNWLCQPIALPLNGGSSPNPSCHIQAMHVPPSKTCPNGGG